MSFRFIRSSTKTDFADAVLKVVGAADDLDFDAHEINRQVSPVNFGKTHGVFLRGDDGGGLALLARLMTFRISCWVKR